MGILSRLLLRWGVKSGTGAVSFRVNVRSVVCARVRMCVCVVCMLGVCALYVLRQAQK